MLNQLDEVVAPHPPHILQTFFPLLGLYGDLTGKSNFSKLVNDVCDFVAANPVPWQIELDNRLIEDRCNSHSLIQIYKAIYETYAERKNSRVWCCKSMANLCYIPQIEKEGLKPLYVHLVRDGRDVAASFRKTIVGEKHIYYLAKQWKTDQETTLKYCQDLAPERYVLILYENLIHDAENTLKILCHHLGLTFDSKVLQFYETQEAKLTAEAGKMWNNVLRPVMEKNSNKFLSQLNEEEILIFESLAGKTLQQFGYTPYFAEDRWRANFTTSELAGYEELNKKMKEEAMRTFDPAGSAKRMKQEAIIRGIKDRSFLV
jgi:hypothetical protein